MDYFECYDLLPKEVINILSSFTNNDYTDCGNLVVSLNEIGWTCDYYLDAVPYNLRML